MEQVDNHSKLNQSSSSTSFERIELQLALDLEGLSKEYLNEVKENIQKDLGLIQREFELQGKIIKHIFIEQAGDETHYRGKCPLFLSFKFENDKEIKLVY